MIDFDFIDWDDPEDEGGNARHISENGVTVEEVEEILTSPSASHDTSRSSGRPLRFGWTSTGKYIVVVYEIGSDGRYTVVRPVTAYEVEPPA